MFLTLSGGICQIVYQLPLSPILITPRRSMCGEVGLEGALCVCLCGAGGHPDPVLNLRHLRFFPLKILRPDLHRPEIMMYFCCTTNYHLIAWQLAFLQRTQVVVILSYGVICHIDHSGFRPIYTVSGLSSNTCLEERPFRFTGMDSK